MRQIALFLLLILFKTSNAASKVYTLLRTDTDLPGPYMIFDKSLASGIFEMEFKTFVDKALMLYQDDSGKSDHIMATLQSGRVYFSFYLSNNHTPVVNPVFKSKKKYNDFDWHSLRIERNASVTSIILDNGKERKSYRTKKYLSSFSSNLLIGGFRKDQLVNGISKLDAFIIYASWENRGFFNACVRNIRYGETGKSVEDITDKYTDRHKVRDGCKLNYCHKPVPICRNNGRCSSVGKKNVSCDCRWTGFTGPRCTQDALQLTLNGTYKVGFRIQKKRRSFEKESYSFRIRTNQRNAVLFSAKGPLNYPDFVLIEIRSSELRLVVNFGAKDYTIASGRMTVSDGKWHTVKYMKNRTSITLKIDSWSRTVQLGVVIYCKMEYSDHSFLGEIAEIPYDNEIHIQDFIWCCPKKPVNFVTGLYSECSNDSMPSFQVIPSHILPTFNENLSRCTGKKITTTVSSGTSNCDKPPCRHNTGPDNQKPTSSEQVPDPDKSARNDGKENEEDDDSSVTWIIVVTIIFSLLLLAAVGFFVYKWNKRYSGDFQVNRKPIGPAGTIVHYQDAAHKEKQLQMKL